MSDWFSRVNQVWLSRIKAAEKSKEKYFGETATKLWGYLTREYTELYCIRSDEQADMPFPVDDGPRYKPRLNKCREFVDLYLPMVLAQTPVRNVSPDRPQFPEEVYKAALPLLTPQGQQALLPYGVYDANLRAGQQTAATLQNWFLNYTPREYRLMREARLALEEGLVKGRGILWHEMLDTGVLEIPSSLYETVDYLLIDPDTITLRDAGYIIRKRRLPTWLASRRLGIEERKLIGLAKKQKWGGKDRPPVTSTTGTEDDDQIDMIEYYEVWSRIGVGHVLAGDQDTELAPIYDALESVGAHVWLAVCEGAKEPLNLHEDLLQGTADEIVAALQWPIRTYGKVADPWPCSILDFRPNSDNAWSSSPMAPGLPMQIFADHLYGYIMSRVRNACKTVVVLANDAPQDLVDAILGGKDLSVVRVARESVADLARELYAVIDIPPLKREVWELLQLNDYYFQKAVGLDAYLYGAQPETQARSAEESRNRQAGATARARDMGDQVDEWMSQAAFKEGLLTRLHVGPREIAPFFGEPFDPEQGVAGPLATVWDQLVNTDDPYEAANEFFYEVVSGSGRRKDKDAQKEDIMTMLQTIMPVVMQMAGKQAEMGNPAAFDQWNEFVRKVAEYLETDLSIFRVNMPVMPLPPAAGSQQTGGGPPKQSPEPQPQEAA